MEQAGSQQIRLKDRTFTLYIGNGALRRRVIELAGTLQRDYRDKNPYFIIVLNGAFIFAADLLREMELQPEMGFIQLSSYKGLKSSGSVRKLLASLDAIRGRDVVIIEDIVETGLTLGRLYELLGDQAPRSLEVVTLLYKARRGAKKLPVKYVGFTIPDKFVVGYGLDYEGYGRNLNELFQLQ